MIAALSQLVALQETDIEIKRCNEEVAALPKRRADIEQQFEASNREFLDLKQQFDDASAERRRLEEDLAAEQTKHDKFKADLMKARNEKEYTTAVREIDVTKKAIGTFETEVLKLMEKIEKLEAQVKERSPEIETKRAEVDRQINELTASAEACRQRLETLTAERARLLGELAPQTRATYERVARLKSGLALAEARDYSCTACRMRIRPQVFNDLRKGDTIITCESCGRILYFKPQVATT